MPKFKAGDIVNIRKNINPRRISDYTRWLNNHLTCRKISTIEDGFVWFVNSPTIVVLSQDIEYSKPVTRRRNVEYR